MLVVTMVLIAARQSATVGSALPRSFYLNGLLLCKVAVWVLKKYYAKFESPKMNLKSIAGGFIFVPF